jgi:hypothetical protein
VFIFVGAKVNNLFYIKKYFLGYFRYNRYKGNIGCSRSGTVDPPEILQQEMLGAEPLATVFTTSPASLQQEYCWRNDPTKKGTLRKESLNQNKHLLCYSKNPEKFSIW